MVRENLKIFLLHFEQKALHLKTASYLILSHLLFVENVNLYLLMIIILSNNL